MNRIRLIGVNGRLHSGKDTLYEITRELTSKRVTRVAFADKLKQSAAAALGYTGDDPIGFCNWLKEEAQFEIKGYEAPPIEGEDPYMGIAFSGRSYLQWYGTEAHRKIFGDDFWVDALLPRPQGGESINLRLRYPGTDILFVTDTRFENEAQRILDLRGEVWRIDADQRLGPLPEDAHVSEHPLPDHLVTHTLDNNGDLTNFRKEINRALTTRVH